LTEFVEARCLEYSDLFYSYPKPIMRADLGRYLVLREFGGVYADIDSEATANVGPLLKLEGAALCL
jgi:mannosyltransferase OCH1-like enzyme